MDRLGPDYFSTLQMKGHILHRALCTSAHFKPTDSHGYLLYSSSHTSNVKNSIPYDQFLRLRRLCNEDFDFSLKSEEMARPHTTNNSLIRSDEGLTLKTSASKSLTVANSHYQPS